MKLEKKYATLIAVIIILIFLFAFSYFSNFSFKPSTTSGTQTTEELPLEEIPKHKTFDFVSASCSVSGNSDIVKFKIQSTGIDIGIGEIAAFLDDAAPPAPGFKDSNGNTIESISLKAGSASNEFSYTTSNHKSSRKITVSSPAGTNSTVVTC